MQQNAEKAVFIFFLVATVGCLGFALLGQNWRWLLTAGLALEIAGLLQLKISGLFSDAPSSMAAAGSTQPGDVLFRCRHTGFYLLTAGLLGQLVSAWVW